MANKDSFDAFVSIIRDKIEELSEHTDQSRIQVFQNELKKSLMILLDLKDTFLAKNMTP